MNTGIINKIWETIYDCKDQRLDGFTSFERKKTLYMIKDMIEKELPKCPTFVGEDEWLKKQGMENGN